MTNPSAYSHRLTELERLGALLGRFMHDLSNETTCMVTTFALMQEPSSMDWQEISQSVDRVGTHLRKFNEILQRIRPGVGLLSVDLFLPSIQEVCAEFPAWKFQNQLTQPMEVYGEPRWLTGALVEILLQLKARDVVPGTIQALAMTADALRQIKFKSLAAPQEDKSFFVLEISFPFTGLPLQTYSVLETEQAEWLISSELLRQMRGFIALQNQADVQKIQLCLSGA